MALTRFSIDVDGVHIEGEGVVTITGAPQDDSTDAFVAFLSNLDPNAVEQAALNRQGFGSGTLAAEMIGVLIDLAQGKPVT